MANTETVPMSAQTTTSKNMLQNDTSEFIDVCCIIQWDWILIKRERVRYEDTLGQITTKTPDITEVLVATVAVFGRIVVHL
ncbi:hypothetical protein CEXT_340381 [Caerostris extrusa]|uniref:Uncharacterized protein n=1 Tax=Caerostris extrusa TaxID=172846 RepID=A0AAV4M6F0_CAEEX|nr:hypothetical protein CEXT_340381 [Caerostris extrusa]